MGTVSGGDPLLDVPRALGLNMLSRFAPRAVRRWAENREMQRRVLSGHRLVNEQRLTTAYRDALRLLRTLSNGHPPGDYLEFGVYNGTSLACMHKALESLALPEVRLFGFDSFEGLPESAAREDDGLWRPGQFRSEERFTRRFLTVEGVDWNRVVLVKGWFEETLQPSLLTAHGIRTAGVIMVDCDLYSSAKQALAFAVPLIRNHSVIVFDDWNSGGLAARGLGEKRAFDEILAEHPGIVARPLDDLAYSQKAKVFLASRAPI